MKLRIAQDRSGHYIIQRKVFLRWKPARDFYNTLVNPTAECRHVYLKALNKRPYDAFSISRLYMDLDECEQAFDCCVKMERARKTIVYGPEYTEIRSIDPHDIKEKFIENL